MFRVTLEGPFVPGKEVRGRITYPGYEDLAMTVTVQRIKLERLFSFTWHPYAIDPNADYSAEPPTLVEFTLQDVPGGTLLVVVESGFAAAVVFAALGDPTRLSLIRRLSAGVPMSIARLTEGSALTRQAVAKHLR